MDRKFVSISTISSRIDNILKTYDEQQQRLKKYESYISDESSSQNTSMTNSEHSLGETSGQSGDLTGSIELKSIVDENSFKYNNITNNEGDDEIESNSSDSCPIGQKRIKKSWMNVKSCRTDKTKLKTNKNLRIKKSGCLQRGSKK